MLSVDPDTLTTEVSLLSKDTVSPEVAEATGVMEETVVLVSAIAAKEIV